MISAIPKSSSARASMKTSSIELAWASRPGLLNEIEGPLVGEDVDLVVRGPCNPHAFVGLELNAVEAGTTDLERSFIVPFRSRGHWNGVTGVEDDPGARRRQGRRDRQLYRGPGQGRDVAPVLKGLGARPV